MRVNFARRLSPTPERIFHSKPPATRESSSRSWSAHGRRFYTGATVVEMHSGERAPTGSSARVLRLAAMTLLLLTGLFMGCAGEAAPAPSTSQTTAKRRSEAASAPTQLKTTGRDQSWPGPRVTARHSAAGVSKLVLRAGATEKATVRVDPDAVDIVVFGTPVLQGLDGPPAGTTEGGFAFEMFGDTLLAATFGEFLYIHFGVVMTDLEVVVPRGIVVTREKMVRNGDKKADKRPPGASPRPEGR